MEKKVLYFLWMGQLLMSTPSCCSLFHTKTIFTFSHSHSALNLGNKKRWKVLLLYFLGASSFLFLLEVFFCLHAEEMTDNQSSQSQRPSKTPLFFELGSNVCHWTIIFAFFAVRGNLIWCYEKWIFFCCENRKGHNIKCCNNYSGSNKKKTFLTASRKTSLQSNVLCHFID